MAVGQVRRPARAPVATADIEIVGEPLLMDDVSCDPGGRVLEPCQILPLRSLYFDANYLLWWTKGMTIPPLVTTGTTGALVPDSDTQILYGDETILDAVRSGFRIQLGSWLDPGHCWGIEGDYWVLGDATDHFHAASNSGGSPRLFRPFFNVNPRDDFGDFAPPAREDAEIVSFPDTLAGAIDVNSYAQLQGSGLMVRRLLCCETSCISGCDPCGPAIAQSSRLDFLIGYRFARLREGLAVREDLTSLLPSPDVGRFGIADSFDTSNTFHGADLGVTWQRHCGPWSAKILGKLALGGVEQSVAIGGQTVISDSLTDDGTYVGGLLAQRTNIGTYRRQVFTMIPELGVNLGYQLAPRLSARVGYNFLYWSRAVRPSDAMDLDVNPDLLPPEQPGFAGPSRPRFTWRDSDFWAQGIHVGLEGVW